MQPISSAPQPPFYPSATSDSHHPNISDIWDIPQIAKILWQSIDINISDETAASVNHALVI